MERKDEKSEKPTVVNGRAFKCLTCGCNRLEEVMVNVVQSSSISIVDESGAADYEATSSDGGEVDRIQCMECGTVIANSYEKLVAAAVAW